MKGTRVKQTVLRPAVTDRWELTAPLTVSGKQDRILVNHNESYTQRNLIMKNSLLGVTLLFMAFTSSGIASAQDIILDDVETAVDQEWAQIRVHFTMPVNYVRHFPQERGQQLEIFLTIVGLDMQNISLLEETRRVPSTPILPGAKITFSPPLSLNLRRDPSTLSVQFDRVVNFNVRPGEDNRSIVIYLPILHVESNPPGIPNK